uniref:CBPC1 carboxypeptidase n=1 Tax=Gongylonema pulchrum TaxID=637853 RepID=A0A183DIM8_9BILA
LGREAALESFISWSTDMGVNHQNVQISYSADIDSFGLKCTKNISSGTVLLQVPRKAILSWDLARKSLFLR